MENIPIGVFGVPIRCCVCKRRFYSNEGRFPTGRPIRINKNFYVCTACKQQLQTNFTNEEISEFRRNHINYNSNLRYWVKWINQGRKKNVPNKKV